MSKILTGAIAAIVASAGMAYAAPMSLVYNAGTVPATTGVSGVPASNAIRDILFPKFDLGYDLTSITIQIFGNVNASLAVTNTGAEGGEITQATLDSNVKVRDTNLTVTQNIFAGALDVTFFEVDGFVVTDPYGVGVGATANFPASGTLNQNASSSVFNIAAIDFADYEGAGNATWGLVASGVLLRAFSTNTTWDAALNEAYSMTSQITYTYEVPDAPTVPLPAALPLLGVGMAAMGLVARRRNKKA